MATISTYGYISDTTEGRVMYTAAEDCVVDVEILNMGSPQAFILEITPTIPVNGRGLSHMAYLKHLATYTKKGIPLKTNDKISFQNTTLGGTSGTVLGVIRYRISGVAEPAAVEEE